MAAATGHKRSITWGSGSTPAWRVLIALKEKELPYESNLIEFSKGGHKTPENLAANPRGQVPTLIDGDVVVCESLAACIYLEEAYPGQGNPLLPPLDNTAGRALVWQRFMESENLFKIVGSLFRITIGMDKAADEEATAKAWVNFETELGRWEAILGKTQYIAGAAFTLADVAIVPTVMLLLRGGADLSAYPKLAAYAELNAARPSVEATWPPHWRGSTSEFFVKK